METPLDEARSIMA
jgi:hypothetical protein